MQDQSLATAAPVRAVGGIGGTQLSGSWNSGEGVERPSHMDSMPHASIHACPCLCLPRVCREHRGRPEPRVPGERAEAHPGLAGELLGAPGPTHMDPPGASLPHTVSSQLSVTFRQLKRVFFIPGLAFFVAKRYPLTFPHTFTAAAMGASEAGRWVASARGETEAQRDTGTTVATPVVLSGVRVQQARGKARTSDLAGAFAPTKSLDVLHEAHGSCQSS